MSTVLLVLLWNAAVYLDAWGENVRDHARIPGLKPWRQPPVFQVGVALHGLAYSAHWYVTYRMLIWLEVIP